ncbi:hypothetical protein BKA62DRAFT_774965 [Auriculariales sp. MPI-PUGE-AT-0066]|nr:hypothetical protein BKA62DRAFT_774965 [Auriculariales sp. MPI-PUGE-AT-0066]
MLVVDVLADTVASLYDLDISYTAEYPILSTIPDYMLNDMSSGNAQSLVDILLLEGTLKIGGRFFVQDAKGI